MVIKRVGPVSCARIAGTIYAVLGLVIGGIVSLFAVAGGLGAQQPRGAGLAALFGTAAVIVLPLVYGCMGFLVTLVSAWLYNMVAEWVGGVEVDIQ